MWFCTGALTCGASHQRSLLAFGGHHFVLARCPVLLGPPIESQWMRAAKLSSEGMMLASGACNEVGAVYMGMTVCLPTHLFQDSGILLGLPCF